MDFFIRGRRQGKSIEVLKYVRANPETMVIVHDATRRNHLLHLADILDNRESVEAGTELHIYREVLHDHIFTSQDHDRLRGTNYPIIVEDLEEWIQSYFGGSRNEVVMVTATGTFR